MTTVRYVASEPLAAEGLQPPAVVLDQLQEDVGAQLLLLVP